MINFLNSIIELHVAIIIFSLVNSLGLIITSVLLISTKRHKPEEVKYEYGMIFLAITIFSILSSIFLIVISTIWFLLPNEKFGINKCNKGCEAKVVKIIDGNIIKVKLDTSQFVKDSIFKRFVKHQIEINTIALKDIEVFEPKYNEEIILNNIKKSCPKRNELEIIKNIWAEEAKIKLINLIYNKNVEIKCDSVEKCYVFFQGKDINKEMVRSGMAWADDYYKETEYQAKKQNLGIWDFYSKACEKGE